MPTPLPVPHAPIRHPHRVQLERKLQLDAQEAEALRFRQVNVSEAFTLQGPDGRFFRCSLTGLGGKGGEALPYEEMARSPESPLDLTLICAVLARQRMLEVVRKATELGVLRIQPVFTESSVQAEGLEHEKAHAWPGAALRAARQCRRASIPLVLPTLPLQEALAGELWTGAECRVFLDDRASDRPKLLRGPASAALAVGPEGGWSDRERALLRQVGGSPFHMGGRVQRAETAAITGLALLQHRLGDL